MISSPNLTRPFLSISLSSTLDFQKTGLFLVRAHSHGITLSSHTTIAETARVGWTFADGVFTPSPATTGQGAPSAQTFTGIPSNVKTFQQIIDSAAQLESAV